MEIFGNIVLFLSIGWVLFFLFDLRARGRRGGVVMPPVLSGHLLFALSIVVVSLFQFSPLHLLWLLPLSFIIGTLILMFPLVQTVLFRFVLTFAPPTEEGMREQEEWERKEEKEVEREREVKRRYKERRKRKKGRKKGN